MAAVEAPDATAPDVVETVAICMAVNVASPLRLVGKPDPTFAVVVTLLVETATAGLVVTFPPAAPILASVVIALVVVVVRLRLCRPVMLPVRLALAVSVTRLSATEAPKPALPVEVAPSPTGSAFAVEELVEVAASTTSGVPPLNVTVPPTSAWVVGFTILIASDPATDRAPPPEPDPASVSKSCC